MADQGSENENVALAPLAARSAVGGVLMGLANLVPGISGGTMLLASGIYTRFIRAIAEVTTLKFRLRSLLVLGCVVGSAAVAILLLAGTVKGELALRVEPRHARYDIDGGELTGPLAQEATFTLVETNQLNQTFEEFIYWRENGLLDLPRLFTRI